MCNAEYDKPQEVDLFVGGKTQTAALKTAIVGHLKSGKTVNLDCIGVAANYVATKAIIMAKGFFSTTTHEIVCTPVFKDYDIFGEDQKVRTGIRWIITLMKNSC